MKELKFLVADMPYVVAFDDDNVNYQSMLPSHGPFVIPPCKDADVLAPAMTLCVGEGRVSDNMEGLEEVGHFPSGDSSYDVFRQTKGGYKIRIVSLDGKPVCVFTTSPRFEECEATLIGTPDEQRFGLQNCIMVCFAFCGAHHGILMMHSSVIKHAGYGFLFQGKSGTGKSTHSRLWLQHISDTELLNDDNPAVRLMSNGEARVYGTPWSGKTPCYRQEWAPIGGFLRLHQAPQNEVRKFTPLEAFASILSSCSTMIWDEPSYDGICQTISGICRTVGCYDLNCLPNDAAARLSHATMTSHLTHK